MSSSSLPNGWRLKKFGDVVSNINESTGDPQSLGLSRVVGLDHMDSESLPLMRWDNLADLHEGTSFTRVFRAGQVLFGKRRAYQRKVSVPQFDGICSGDILVFQPSKGELLANFLPYLVQSDEFFDHALGTSAGSLSPRTKWQELAKYEFALPPLAEQQRIVNLISAIDETIDSYRAVPLCVQRESMLQEMLNEGGDRWTESTLGKVLQISRGGSPRPIQDFITEAEDGINWIKIGDATASSKYIYETEQKIRPEGASRSRKVSSGDFLLSNSMSFGRPYIMRTTGCIHDGWLLLGSVNRHFDEDFLYNLLISSNVQTQFNSLAAGSGVRNLNIDVVSEICVPLPSKQEQREIAILLNAFDDIENALKDAVVRAKNLRSGLLTDLLSGDHEFSASNNRFVPAASKLIGFRARTLNDQSVAGAENV